MIDKSGLLFGLRLIIAVTLLFLIVRLLDFQQMAVTLASVSPAPIVASLVLMLSAGVNGALLTGDIFNLFVFIEVMLLPSYGLLVLSRRKEGTERSVTGSRLYVTFNLFVSAVFLAGVAFVYGTAGTVNLAELAGAASESTVVAVACAVCLFALGMKAATVPTHGWLARAYPSTSPAVTALFSGLHTKVAIYAIYRVYAVVFDGDPRFRALLLILASVTMVAGVLGAVGRDTMREILAFHMVSQMGYIALGLGLANDPALLGAYLHVLSDLLGSVGALLAGVIIVTAGWTPADAIISLFIAALVLAGAWRLVRESADVLLEATPAHIALSDVHDRLATVPGVASVHDLHVWTVTSGVVAMSGHLVVAEPTENQRVLEEAQARMEGLGIAHVTVQIERHQTCAEPA